MGDMKNTMEGGMEIFAKASDYLGNLGEKAGRNEGPNEDLAMLIPSVILKALACEVGLKTLLKIEGKDAEKAHNLKTLFEKVENSHQAEISEVLLAKMKKVDESYNEQKLTEDLDEVKNAFIEWRYFYENPHKTSYTFLNELYKSIRMIVYSAEQEND